MAGRLTQETVESLNTGTPTGRLTQEAVESLGTGTPKGRLTQEAVEALAAGTPTGRLTQDASEVLVAIYRYLYAGVGGLVIGVTPASNSLRLIYSASGSLLLYGTADVVFTPIINSYEFDASGLLVLGNAASSITVSLPFEASGPITFSGSVEDATVILPFNSSGFIAFSGGVSDASFSPHIVGGYYTGSDMSSLGHEIAVTMFEFEGIVYMYLCAEDTCLLAFPATVTSPPFNAQVEVAGDIVTAGLTGLDVLVTVTPTYVWHYHGRGINQIAGTATYEQIEPFEETMPIGAQYLYPSATPPAGSLLLDGSSILRSAHPILFSLYGTVFGSADGTHFNIPDMRGRFARGAGSGAGLTTVSIAGTGGEETHTLTTSELPSHNHSVTDTGHSHSVTDSGHHHDSNDGQLVATMGGGSVYESGSPDGGIGEAFTGSATTGISIDSASTGLTIDSTGSDTAHNILPPWLSIGWWMVIDG